MSEVLHFPRLFLLLKNHVTENKHRYLLYTLGILIIGFIVFILAVSVGNFYGNYFEYKNGELQNPNTTSDWEEFQVAIYYSGLYIFAGVFACLSFVNFSNSAEAIFYLNKPASYLEKWLTEVIVRVGLFLVAYTVLFYILTIPFTLYVRSIESYHHLNNSYATELDLGIVKEFRHSRFFFFVLSDTPLLVILSFISAYFSVISFFMYGAALFNRFSFFKTLFFGFLIAMVYTFYALVLVDSNWLMPDGWDFDFPGNARDDGNIEDYQSGFKAVLSESVVEGVVYFLLLFVPTILLISSYFKLKEKEV